MLARRVRLIAVEGEQEEFADLVGSHGVLRPSSEGLTFFPESQGDWLHLVGPRETRENGKVKIATALGNTFIFRLL